MIVTVTGLGFSNLEALKMTTGNPAEVLNLSGEMNPYKEGALGVIQEGAYADIIIVEGNPLIEIMALKRDHVKVVMKNGVVHKNTF